MPFLAMDELTERAAYVALGSVLCEPDPRHGDVRAGLRPGLLRDDLEHTARQVRRQGDTLMADRLAGAAVEMPSALSSRLAWRTAWPEIRLTSQVCWFLVTARLLGEERFVSVGAACRAWAIAANKPGTNVSQKARHVQKRWRRYRPAAHLCAALCAFCHDGRAGYVNLLAVAEALLDFLAVKPRHARQRLLDPRDAWRVPEGLGLLRAELRLDADPVDFARLTAGLR